jgi:hypothetical protein
MANQSSTYGNYGGVTNCNYYATPASPPFVPIPPAAITPLERQALRTLLDNTDFILNNVQNILLRTNTERIIDPNNPDNIDTFVMSTSANPEDVITYTSDTNTVSLNELDGGSF